MVVGRLLSYWEGSFSGAVLISGGYHLYIHKIYMQNWWFTPWNFVVIAGSSKLPKNLGVWLYEMPLGNRFFGRQQDSVDLLAGKKEGVFVGWLSDTPVILLMVQKFWLTTCYIWNPMKRGIFQPISTGESTGFLNHQQGVERQVTRDANKTTCPKLKELRRNNLKFTTKSEWQQWK